MENDKRDQNKPLCSTERRHEQVQGHQQNQNAVTTRPETGENHQQEGKLYRKGNKGVGKSAISKGYKYCKIYV